MLLADKNRDSFDEQVTEVCLVDNDLNRWRLKLKKSDASTLGKCNVTTTGF